MAMFTRSSEFLCGAVDPSRAAESAAFLPIMSALSTATIDSLLTVGCCTKYLEPSNPRSSAPCHTNNADRLPGLAF
ncbi:MAG: hypothetical protein JWQ28_2015 [Pedobacter sp.]|nr:hypothetical protein [Pedobacter sp.]